jgi:hypothetical protein
VRNLLVDNPIGVACSNELRLPGDRENSYRIEQPCGVRHNIRSHPAKTFRPIGEPGLIPWSVRLAGRRVMKGYAPGWQIRCTKCGQTRDASEAGLVRIGALSWKKFTLGFCSHCHRLRFIAIEKKIAYADDTKAQTVDA